ncbi:M56 family metallopeptidase [Guptibacillus hwajinpoensis]|uniref:M56 family metallopeptidase n=1 Tax=Guptibacillus hwajinpoensis TaxID=208199 RepID=UPI001CD3AEE5|nr:M56 family metallopeptidase [Pseudalkalibacillus hwajinpoensis]MCA0991306.1 M48 family metalloprotease [Pseudalkalibacillus hwajinpoensis]
MKIKQTGLVFTLSLFLVAAVVVQMAMYSLHLFSNWNLIFTVLEACHNLFRAIGISSMNVFLEVLILSTLTLVVIVLVKQFARFITFSKRVSLLQDDPATKKVIVHYNLNQITVITSEEPIALTYGLIKPKIVVSTALVNMLTEEELRAVICHEQFHQQHRDPLKKFLITLFVTALWYVPILKWVSKHYQTLREIEADKFAMLQTNNMLDLSSALLKLLKNEYRQRHAFAVSFADTSVNDRIQHILSPEKEVHATLPVETILYSVFIVLGLTVMFTVATP